MKFIHRKPSAKFPQTPVWGITATKWAVVISFGLHSVVIELPRRKLTKRALDFCPKCFDTGYRRVSPTILAKCSCEHGQRQ